MPTGRPLTPAQRQQIITFRQPPHNCSYNQIVARTGRPYNTVATVCRDANLQREPTQRISVVHDPAGLFGPGPVTWTQTDLNAMLYLSNLPEGFTVTIGQRRLEVRDNCFYRDDGYCCPPNKSGGLRWYPPKGVK